MLAIAAMVPASARFDARDQCRVKPETKIKPRAPISLQFAGNALA